MKHKGTNAFKTISKTADELRVGNYIILFGGRDLEWTKSGRNPDGSLGTYFRADTEVDSDYTKSGKLSMDFEHGSDPDRVGIGDDVLGFVDWKTARKDEKGIFVERVLNRRQKYVQFLEELIDAGLVGNSSEAIPSGIKMLDDGAVVRWPLKRDTLTVQPCEPRMLSANALQALKSLSEQIPSARALIDSIHLDQESGGTGEAQPTGAPAGQKRGAGTHKFRKGVTSMNIIEAIKKLIPGLSAEQLAQLAAVLGLAGVDAGSMASDGAGDGASMDAGMGAGKADATMRSVDLDALAKGLKALGFEAKLPAAEGKTPAPVGVRPPYAFQDAGNKPEETTHQKSLNALYVTRFGEEDEAKKAIMTDMIGPDYRQKIYEQNVAFARYLKRGSDGLSREEVKALKSIYFPIDQVLAFSKEGVAISELKATQVEAIGELGGFAVPPNIQAEISRRLPGLTIVRGAGARVVTLATGNSIEITQYVSDDATQRYIGTMRGSWGTETQTPEQKGFKLKMVPVIANIYTFKVDLSMSLVEDAANLMSLVTEDIAMTAAMDEDECNLIGDGIGKPLGILPGGANALSLTEVNSGGAAALTTGGIKKLKRGLAWQYRARAVVVGNSDTFSAVEALTATDGKPIFEDISDTGKLQGQRVFESEAMPDVAANAYPLLEADMSGYTIVERLGMSVERFHDSGTGPNKVQLAVRRRVGGRVEKDWLFAVQKVAA